MVAEGSDIAGIDDVPSVVVGEGSSHEELIRDLYPDVELVVVDNPASFPGMIERGKSTPWCETYTKIGQTTL